MFAFISNCLKPFGLELLSENLGQTMSTSKKKTCMVSSNQNKHVCNVSIKKQEFEVEKEWGAILSLLLHGYVRKTHNARVPNDILCVIKLFTIKLRDLFKIQLHETSLILSIIHYNIKHYK